MALQLNGFEVESPSPIAQAIRPVEYRIEAVLELKEFQSPRARKGARNPPNACPLDDHLVRAA
ncbi:hypothetical protein SAMN05421753_12024 [Planctomicrobium piriforme]|uniref:Uncharacterized protein n=1 Tax=Planctomicrobium piriforme TaxID=1576369 RepID=A0A1I3R6P5_9PLAN|nr:hypothetical protein SAMN05421753_12024 [Planctomicrobium piriforme]